MDGTNFGTVYLGQPKSTSTVDIEQRATSQASVTANSGTANAITTGANSAAATATNDPTAGAAAALQSVSATGASQVSTVKNVPTTTSGSCPNQVAITATNAGADALTGVGTAAAATAHACGVGTAENDGRPCAKAAHSNASSIASLAAHVSSPSGFDTVAFPLVQIGPSTTANYTVAHQDGLRGNGTCDIRGCVHAEAKRTWGTILLGGVPPGFQPSTTFLNSLADGGCVPRPRHPSFVATTTEDNNVYSGGVTYNPTAPGTITKNSNGTLPKIDDITMSSAPIGTRVLVKDAGVASGIYTVTRNSGGTPWQLTRAADMAHGSSFGGVSTTVVNGDTQAGTSWATTNSGTVGTASSTWAQSGGSNFAACILGPSAISGATETAIAEAGIGTVASLVQPSVVRTGRARYWNGTAVDDGQRPAERGQRHLIEPAQLTFTKGTGTAQRKIVMDIALAYGDAPAPVTSDSTCFNKQKSAKTAACRLAASASAQSIVKGTIQYTFLSNASGTMTSLFNLVMSIDFGTINADASYTDPPDA